MAKGYFFAKAVLLKERMMKEIEQFATQFRRAIDLALEAGEFDNDSIYRRFPRACCGDTSCWIRVSKQIMSVERIGVKQMGMDNPMRG